MNQAQTDAQFDTRVQEIFVRLRTRTFRQTDRMFAVLMPMQWAFSIALAMLYTPRTWAGAESAVHPHVWFAVFLGGALTLPPVVAAVFWPGAHVTRFVVMFAQIVTGLVLIDLTGGRIETHFHLFGSLAFLALYRDWRMLVYSALLIAGDHAWRGLYWPESIYGVNYPEPWRFLEHAAWVVFEVVVLIVACNREVRNMRYAARQRAELERGNDRYRAVMEQTGDGIAVVDAASGAVLECNPAFQSLLGTGAETAGLTISDEMLHGNRTLEVLFRDLRRDGAPIHDERRLRRVDGTLVEVGVTLTATSYAGSEAVTLVARDITAQKRVESELAAARDAALESARAKSQFLANMSHEIRTPMNGVIGMTDLLLETPLTADQRDFAETIQRSGGALLTVINDILDFSKIEAGHLEFDHADFDVREVVEGTADLLAESAFVKGLELVTYVEPSAPTAVRGDAGRVRQVLTNLLGNALKFTAHGEVEVRVTALDEAAPNVRLRIEVRDTGIGIPDAVQAKLFQPFVQADGSTTRRFGGTGLGLAISRHLVEKMGGEIGVKSVAGEGSTFWFTVVLEMQAEPSVQSPRLDGHLVLVVDDNETNRKLLRYRMTGWGVEPVLVDSAATAMAALRSAVRSGRRFDAILLDRQMPITDGVEFARMVSADPEIAGVPMVMMSSMGEMGDRAELATLGIAFHVAKPVKCAALRATLSEAFGVRGRRQTATAPAPPPTTATAAAATPAGSPKPMSSARILVAEDSIVNQKVVTLQLRGFGYNPVIVGNGREALDAVRAQDWDLILMDCQMPEMDGYEATGAIRSLPEPKARVPIIAMTAHAMTGDRDRCLAAGMDDYISKPVQKGVLEQALRRWLIAAEQRQAS